MSSHSARPRALTRPGVVAATTVAYLAGGALIPFAHQPELSPAARQALPSVARYRSPEGSLDRAAIVESNTDALATRLRMIASACSQLVVTTFDFRADNSGTDVIAALLAAADRGVDVRVLVDGYSELLRMRAEPAFHALAEHDRVEVRAYNPPTLVSPWTMLGRYHDKIILVDDTLALLGGRNTYDFFLGDYPTDHRSHDREVLVHAPRGVAFGGGPRRSVIGELRGYVDSVWAGPHTRTVLEQRALGLGAAEVDAAASALRARAERARGALGDTSDAGWEAATMAVDRVSLLANPTHTLSKEPVVWSGLMALAEQATDDVLLQTPYYVANQAMNDDLARVASGRPTRLLLNSGHSGDNVVASGDYRYQRDDVLATGAQVMEYFGEASSHAKSVALDDDLAAVGSFNLDMLSTHGNTESMLVVAGEAFNAELRGHMATALEQAVPVRADGSCATGDGEPPVGIAPDKDRLLAVLGIVGMPFRFLI